MENSPFSFVCVILCVLIFFVVLGELFSARAFYLSLGKAFFHSVPIQQVGK